MLTAPQPLAAWSRAKWEPLATKIGPEVFIAAVCDSSRADAARNRAIDIATELFDGLPREVVRKPLQSTEDPFGLIDSEEVVAHAIWSVSRLGQTHDKLDVIKLASERSAHRARRSAYEALGAFDGELSDDYEFSLIAQSTDRYVRAAATLAMRQLKQGTIPGDGDTPWGVVAQLRFIAAFKTLNESHFTKALQQFEAAQKNEDDLWAVLDEERDTVRWTVMMDALRVMQLCLGDVCASPTKPDVYSGYVANSPNNISRTARDSAVNYLAHAFPIASDAESFSRDEELFLQQINAELLRLISMLEPDDEALANTIAETDYYPDLEDRIHSLIVLSRVAGARSSEATRNTADNLCLLHYKMLGDLFLKKEQKKIPSRNWPLRVGEVFVELCKKDPNLAGELAPRIEFPDQTFFAALMPEKERALAARHLLEKSKTWDEDTLWTPEMVRLVAALGEDDALIAVRGQWHDFSLRDVILETLAAKPAAANRELFFQALALPDANSVARAATAIAALDAAGTPEEIAATMSALRQQCNAIENRTARAALAVTLKVLSGEKLETPEPEAPTGETPVPLDQATITRVYQPWFDWFAKTHPEQSKQLDAAAALDGVDLAERVTKIDWPAGDAERGAVVYNARACAKCHSGASRVGPELTGVTGRWSHEDLLREIADPNRNVAPQYHTTRLVTRDGKVYQGVLVYDSPEGTLIQTAGDTTTRIAGDEIVRTTKTTQSLMPTGLLNGLADSEIADLVAYLKTLAPTRQE